ncbi:hypothetical protein Hypma_011559 [Hypsizygus marmoreus]|uniref:Uncharacterized protein n=1 Tax=Hypsizygus marmoreus TaxID=39966 RepID=A0A369JNX6_HYPMA|nr:hypothetical protein Hypma_011559 [Hypsizygus marmoreus]
MPASPDPASYSPRLMNGSTPVPMEEEWGKHNSCHQRSVPNCAKPPVWEEFSPYGFEIEARVDYHHMERKEG